MEAVKLDLYPDRAMYRPGEPVTLTLEHSAAQRPRPVTATLTIYARGAAVHSETRTLDLAAAELATFAWQPPSDRAGYGAEVALTQPGDGRLLEEVGTAFDVHESWLEAPRYGFMTDFGPDGVDPSRIPKLAKHHVNALQFYDWMYRHDEHLPPQDEFVEPLGRRTSLSVVRRLIDQAHGHGIAAMPYTTIYGASFAYFQEHPEEALHRPNGQPWTFIENVLVTMDPSPGSNWREHILAEYDRILAALPFDGLHIDQYGDPKTPANADGQVVRLADVIPGFLKDAKAVARKYPGRDAVVFNLVNDWPSETVAGSGVDLVYAEIWPPHDDYASLRDIVHNAKRLSGGKPVILPAYLTASTDAGTRLLDAVIAASGANHLELGEDGGLLGDPYFPKYEHPSPELAAWLRRFFDFVTRHQHYLFSGMPVPRPAKVELEGAPFTVGSFPANQVWGLVGRGADFEALHLVNLTASPQPTWRTAKDAPEPLSDLAVRYPTTLPVRAVYAATPDDKSGRLNPLEFNQADGVVSFVVPRLEYWTMLVLETQ